MSEIASQRRITGNVSLYRLLAAREPRVFLRRNLNTVLDAHNASLEAAKAGHATAPYEAMIANERRRAGWDFPTRLMLNDLLKGQRPVLQIDALRLKSLNIAKGPRASVKTALRVGSDLEPEWLPHAQTGLRYLCQVFVTVRDIRAPRSEQLRHSQSGVIREDSAVFNDPCNFVVELTEPILIELDSLFVAEESGSNGFRHWKRTVTKKYSLEVKLTCKNSADSAAFLSRLESRSQSDYSNKPPNEAVIQAVWDELPKCPPSGYLLPLKRASGHSSVSVGYGMDLSMGWLRRHKTPLERFNRLRGTHMQQQLLTPSSSDSPEAANKPQYIVRYVHENGLDGRAFTVDSLSCLFCASGRREGRTEMYNSRSALLEPSQAIDRLMLHYWSCHDVFDCDRDEELVTETGKIMVTVRFKLKEKQVSAAMTENAAREEFSWIAPHRSFDIKAHLAGDHSWTGDGGGKRRRGRPMKSKQSEANESLAPPIVVKEAKTVGEVLDIPLSQKEKFRVPAVPRVTFYHSSTKEPILPDEELSESEDDLLDDRLISSQRREFTEAGLNRGAQDFNEAFNKHIDFEQSSSKKLTRDALVRFARMQRGKQRDADWLRAFEQKLEHLHIQGIVADDVAEYCNDLMKPRTAGCQHTAKPGPVQSESNALQQEFSNTKAAALLESTLKTGKDTEAYPDLIDVVGPSPTRLNGRFVSSQSGHGDSVPKADAEEPTPPKKKRKPHRWSGGGADREIIEKGYEQLPNGVDLVRPAKERSKDSGAPSTESPRTSMLKQRLPQVVRPPSSDGTNAVYKPGGVRSPACEGPGKAMRKQTSEAGLNINGYGPPHVAKTSNHESRTRPASLFVQRAPAEARHPKWYPNNNGSSRKENCSGRSTCNCGATATPGRGTIACDNERCTPGLFHLKCVGLEARVPDWVCDACNV
ncbi:hypothetical protein BAUCODRAFT_34144 [Baudoinia panamericana UAMH 10762]|uniref:Zinc finger PHD-type domain-containing protein n=1 Tax=Baudoinia panamericana (strain UAMH 10762) TaxID=717646 RepID=M2LQP3_BAUPA|nr:uncharacterized protein BAUCODRAFT_34144 [Baudoinia panamericana UAMH 10762]EMC96752.1 hypothetical protein BAUCODRAFT_34144 [Baudoinia panamericana UAMH 10762]